MFFFLENEDAQIRDAEKIYSGFYVEYFLNSIYLNDELDAGERDIESFLNLYQNILIQFKNLSVVKNLRSNFLVQYSTDALLRESEYPSHRLKVAHSNDMEDLESIYENISSFDSIIVQCYIINN